METQKKPREDAAAMTGERLAQIAARCSAATSNEWRAVYDGTGPIYDPGDPAPRKYKTSVIAFGRGRVCDTSDIQEAGDLAAWEQSEADAQFIAAAHQDIPDLLAEICRLQKQAASLRAIAEGGAAPTTDEAAAHHDAGGFWYVDGVVIEWVGDGDRWITFFGNQPYAPQLDARWVALNNDCLPCVRTVVAKGGV